MTLGRSLRPFLGAGALAPLGGCGAWSGPFVYGLLATLATPFGATMESVRLVVAALSWGTCALAYSHFRDRLGARPLDAL